MQNLRIVCLLAILAACSSTPDPKEPRTEKFNVGADAPAWVNQPYSEFPQDRYIVSVGMGPTVDQASDDARRLMAQGFRTEVQNVTQVSMGSVLDKNTSGKQEGQSSDQYSQTTTLVSNAAIRGAEVKKTFVGADKMAYALVAIDKLQARVGVLQDLNRLELKMSSTLDQLEAQEKPRYGKYKEFLGMMQGYEVLLGEANALGVTASDRAMKIETRGMQLLKRWNERFQKESVKVELKDGPPGLVSKLEECMQEFGIQIAGGSSAEAIVTTKVILNFRERPDHMNVEGWVKVKGDLTAEMIQGASKKSAVVTGFETGRSKEAAVDSLAETLSKQICPKVIESI